MTQEVIHYRFRLRRAKAATWAATNDVLLDGEIGLETDTTWPVGGGRKYKMGPGAWNDLDYAVPDSDDTGDIVNPSGTSYTPVLSDAGNTIISGSSTGFALTIPANADVAFPKGTKIAYTQGAAGQITVAGDTGVTVHAPNGNTTGAQWDGGVAEKIDDDEWQLWNGPALGALATEDDAPSDGKDYVRKNGSWSEASSAGSGAITGINEQTGTSYTLELTDATKVVRMTNSAACALEIPTHASIALPLYAMIPTLQGGAGAITVSGASGVTIESPNGAATDGNGDFRVLFQRATDVWVIG